MKHPNSSRIPVVIFFLVISKIEIVDITMNFVYAYLHSQKKSDDQIFLFEMSKIEDKNLDIALDITMTKTKMNEKIIFPISRK